MGFNLGFKVLKEAAGEKALAAVTRISGPPCNPGEAAD